MANPLIILPMRPVMVEFVLEAIGIRGVLSFPIKT
jgi:hypothetical protein